MTATPATGVLSHPALPADIRTALERFGVIQKVATDEVIFQQGSTGDSMYLIESGSVELFFGDPGQRRKPLGVGMLFGELALLAGDHTRTATAVTTAPCSMRVIDHGAFDDMLRWAPQLSVTLLRLTCIYLVESEQHLIDEMAGRNRELEQTLDFLRRTREDLDTTELLSLTDELTGLYNRRCLNRQSEGVLREADATPTRVALVLIDVDHFKQVNDRYGHAIGDAALRYISSAIKEGLRQTDLPCRLGGDEFAVLLHHLGDGQAVATACRLPKRVAAIRIPTAEGEVKVTCSVGGATYQSGEGWNAFFDRADHSLYLAKESGRNRVAWDGELVQGGD